MRLILSLIAVSGLLASCQSNKNTTSEKLPGSAVATEWKRTTIEDTIAPANSVKNLQMLALTSNALQLVNSRSGSTREISFGMPFDQLVGIVSRVLESEPSGVGVNTECGAGPLKVARWSSGLSLVFAEKKRGDSTWLFAGWFVDKPKEVNPQKLTTMAGIGIGSTLKELKDAYRANVTKTSLGHEFSVDSGFFGLLSGEEQDAVIEVMWSGTSCNFS